MEGPLTPALVLGASLSPESQFPCWKKRDCAAYLGQRQEGQLGGGLDNVGKVAEE